MSHKMIAKILGVAFALSPAPAFWADAAARDSQLLPHFDNMRYFILDASKQAEGSRSITYINLIGDFDAKSFKVYYNGSATGLARTHVPRRLQVILMHSGNVVGTTDIADLTTAHGSIALHKRVVANCTVPMGDIDQVDARIDR